jgi:hypothetical protein
MSLSFIFIFKLIVIKYTLILFLLDMSPKIDRWLVGKMRDREAV